MRRRQFLVEQNPTFTTFETFEHYIGESTVQLDPDYNVG